MVDSADWTRGAISDRVTSAYNLGVNPDAYYNPDAKQLDDSGNEIKGLVKSSDISPENLNIGGAAARGAIQNRADAKFFNPQEVMDKRKLRYVQNAENQVGRAKDLAMGQYRIDTAQINAQNERNSMENAQRSALAGSIFGLIGTVGGGIAGGPVGAAAGGQAGRVAGSASANY